MMRLLRAGSLPWLIGHEIRIAYRGWGAGTIARIAGALLLLAYIRGGVAVGGLLRRVPFEPTPWWYSLATIALLAVFAFMVVQALMAAQRTLYHSGDLDLLLCSPLPPGRVLAAKLAGIAGTVAGTFAVLTLPMVLPGALLAHAQLLGVVPVLITLALVATSTGVGLTVLLVRLFGARMARILGSILGAVLGATVFLGLQFSMLRGRRGQIELDEMLAAVTSIDLGREGLASLPARAALGDGLALVAVLVVGVAVFASAIASFQVYFLSAFQKAGERRQRQGLSQSGKLRGFGGGLVRRMLVKELKLLWREPEVLFQIALRLLYLTPLLYVATRRGAEVSDPRILVAAGAVVAGQLAGSVAWLAMSAESSPDLLAVAPVGKRAITRAKLGSSLLMALPFAVIIPLILLPRAPQIAGVGLVGALAAAAASGLIELMFAQPQSRSSFNVRRGASLVGRILGLITTLFVGILTGQLAGLFR